VSRPHPLTDAPTGLLVPNRSYATQANRIRDLEVWLTRRGLRATLADLVAERMRRDLPLRPRSVDSERRRRPGTSAPAASSCPTHPIFKD
jgi:hypothetical protein